MSFTINVAKPYIPENLNIEHIETQYIIAKDRDFTNIIISYTSQTNIELLKYYNDITMSKDDLFYYKVILKFSNGLTMESDIDTIIYNKVSDVRVSTIYTPKITIDQSTLDVGTKNVSVETSNISFVYEYKDHISTDWYVKTTSGDILWKREIDKYNLTRILIPKNVFTGYGNYVIEARHRCENDESFLGRLVVANELIDSKIVLNSEPVIYFKNNTTLEINVNSIIHNRITWSLYKNETVIYEDKEADTYISNFKTYITIPGDILVPNETYKLKIKTFTYDNNYIERDFDVACSNYVELYNRYIVYIDKFEITEPYNVDLQLPNIYGSTKEYYSRIVPIYTGPKLLFLDLDTMDYNRQILSVNKNEVDEYRVDFKNNKLIYEGVKYEETTNGKYLISHRYSSHIIVNSLTDITDPTLESGSIITSTSEEMNFGYGFISDLYNDKDIISIYKNKNDNNYSLYDVMNAETIPNAEITNLRQYYQSVDINNNGEALGSLHAIKLYGTNYIFVEYRGIVSKVNVLDRSVESNTFNDFIDSYKTHLFQANRDIVIIIKEVNTKVFVLFINVIDLSIIKTIETDLLYNKSIFINTLENELMLLYNNNDVTSIYKIH